MSDAENDDVTFLKHDIPSRPRKHRGPDVASLCAQHEEVAHRRNMMARVRELDEASSRGQQSASVPHASRVEYPARFPRCE